MDDPKTKEPARNRVPDVIRRARELQHQLDKEPYIRTAAYQLCTDKAMLEFQLAQAKETIQLLQQIKKERGNANQGR